MLKRTHFKHTLFFCLLILLSSCIQGANEIKNWIDSNSNTKNIDGNYTFLSENGIKVFLPAVFKKQSFIEYQNTLKLVLDETSYRQENKRLNLLRKADGDFHIFFDKVTQSTYTLNTLPYFSMSKKDAQYLLGMIRKNNEQFAKNSNVKFTKTTARYYSEFGPQIFKVVHKVDNSTTNNSSYNSTYIVSYNMKTVYIQLSTPYEVNFDPYLQKMIL